MPKRPGLRDDDTMGRLADIERRMDAIEAALAKDEKKPVKAKE